MTKVKHCGGVHPSVRDRNCEGWGTRALSLEKRGGCGRCGVGWDSDEDGAG